MSKLSEDVLEKGREVVRKGDLDGLMMWQKAYAPLINGEFVLKTFGVLFRVENTDRALKLFDDVFAGYDQAKELRAILLKFVTLIMLVLGIVGGLIYLFQSCVGWR